MNKLVPFIFPLIALVIVLALLLRWYSLRTNPNGQISQEGQNIEVTDISAEDEARISRGAQDLQSIDLEPAATDSAQAAQGRVRYETVDGKLNFSISAILAQPQGIYQVWLRSEGQTTKAMQLELEKGGWMASGSISIEHLPLQIIVSQESNNDNTMEVIILNGQIEATE